MSEEKVFMARVAEQAEQYEDMVEFLKPVIDEKAPDLSTDERNLLSVAFKNLINGKRSACRTISAIEQNPKYSKFGDALAKYKQEIEGKLYKDCEHIVDIIRSKVLSKSPQGESLAFFAKMIGDYYRYIAETATGAKLEEVKQEALKAYNQASEPTLPPCNSIKLGLVLNFSVFHYEVLKDRKKACQLADEALQQALEKIDEIGEDDFREAKSIIELLKENLTLWKEEEEGGAEDI